MLFTPVHAKQKRTAHNHHLAMLRMAFSADVVVWPATQVTFTGITTRITWMLHVMWPATKGSSTRPIALSPLLIVTGGVVKQTTRSANTYIKFCSYHTLSVLDLSPIA